QRRSHAAAERRARRNLARPRGRLSTRPGELADGPGVAAVEERPQVGRRPRACGGHLLVEGVLVTWPLDRAEDADRRREVWRAEARDQVGERRVRLVVHEEVRFADTVPELDHLGLEVPQANALVAVPAEDERLAVLEHERVIGLRRLF